MTFNEAIDVLKKGRKIGDEEQNAIDTINSELVLTKNTRLTFATLVARLTDSTNPAFSYRVLGCILESGGEKMEDDITLRGLFIRKTLSSTTVREGISRCMVALAACTKVKGNNERL